MKMAEIRQGLNKEMENRADVLNAEIKLDGGRGADCHPADYKLPFPSDCLVSNGIADAVTGKATDPFPSYSCNLKRSQAHMAVSGSL